MAHVEEIITKIAYLEIEQHIFFEDVDSFIEQKVNFNHVMVMNLQRSSTSGPTRRSSSTSAR